MEIVFKIPSGKPSPVGEILKTEFLSPLKITQGELAKAMGVSRRKVNELCMNRRGVTAETAFLLAKAFGTTPEFWLNLQIISDLWAIQNRESPKDKLDKAQALISPEADHRSNPYFAPSKARLNEITHMGNELLSKSSDEELGDFDE